MSDRVNSLLDELDDAPEYILHFGNAKFSRIFHREILSCFAKFSLTLPNFGEFSQTLPTFAKGPYLLSRDSGPHNLYLLNN